MYICMAKKNINIQEGKQPNSVKALASMLRDDNPSTETKNIGQVDIEAEPESKKEDKKDTPLDAIQKNSFELLLEEVENSNYKIDKETLYVDSDIKEIFVKLKHNGKIKISHLVSRILEDWVNQNIEEIQKITNKSNRFLK